MDIRITPLEGINNAFWLMLANADKNKRKRFKTSLRRLMSNNRAFKRGAENQPDYFVSKEAAQKAALRIEHDLWERSNPEKVKQIDKVHEHGSFYFKGV